MSRRRYGADCHRPPFLVACLIQSSSDLPPTQYIQHLALSPSLASSRVSQHMQILYWEQSPSLLTAHVVLTFMGASAPSQGVPESLSSYLISITNAGNAIGRLAGGVLGDRFGKFPPVSSRLPSLTSHPSRPDQCHDSCITHRRRTDPHMAVYTWDSCALYARGDLRRGIRRNGDPHGRADDGAR
jgi:hypothetical protein